MLRYWLQERNKQRIGTWNGAKARLHLSTFSSRYNVQSLLLPTMQSEQPGACSSGQLQHQVKYGHEVGHAGTTYVAFVSVVAVPESESSFPGTSQACQAEQAHQTIQDTASRLLVIDQDRVCGSAYPKSYRLIQCCDAQVQRYKPKLRRSSPTLPTKAATLKSNSTHQCLAQCSTELPICPTWCSSIKSNAETMEPSPNWSITVNLTREYARDWLGRASLRIWHKFDLSQWCQPNVFVIAGHRGLKRRHMPEILFM